MVGLKGAEKINPYDLGLSDRKMVSIAAIVAMDTKVVIFDEPTIAQGLYRKETDPVYYERITEGT